MYDLSHAAAPNAHGREPDFRDELAHRHHAGMVMIEAMARSIGEGFDVEELPSALPIYYARKGNERRCLCLAGCKN